MDTAIRNASKKLSREKACRLFLTKHSEMPSALLGGRMEREAYLDILAPSVPDPVVKPKTRKQNGPSR